MEPRSGRLSTLLVATLATVFVLVIWGGVVRLSGSGLAIPDWPLAEGKLLPRPHPNVLIEFGHRVIAMLVSFLTIAIAIVVFRSREYRRTLGALTVAALITLALQVFMGGRVVLEELLVDRVVAHLLLAFTFFAILLLMALRVTEGEPGPAPDPRARLLGRFAHLGAGAVFLQAGLGAWVSSSGAALGDAVERKRAPLPGTRHRGVQVALEVLVERVRRARRQGDREEHQRESGGVAEERALDDEPRHRGDHHQDHDPGLREQDVVKHA